MPNTLSAHGRRSSAEDQKFVNSGNPLEELVILQRSQGAVAKPDASTVSYYLGLGSNSNTGIVYPTVEDEAGRPAWLFPYPADLPLNISFQ